MAVAGHALVSMEHLGRKSQDRLDVVHALHVELFSLLVLVDDLGLCHGCDQYQKSD